MRITKNVMVFGSFDVIHPGHISFFEQAKSFGDKLVVVVARDDTIAEMKGKKPHYSDSERLNHVKSIKAVDSAVLGNLDDKYRVIEKQKPDIICLGYDQTFFTDNLENELKKRKIKADIIRLREYKPHIYKSSKIKAHS